MSGIPLYSAINEIRIGNFNTYSVNKYDSVIIAPKGLVDFSESKGGKFNLSYLSNFTWFVARGSSSERFLKNNLLKYDIELTYANDLDIIISAVLLGLGIANVPLEYLRYTNKNSYDILPVDDSLSELFVGLDQQNYVHIIKRLKQPILIQSSLDHIKSYNK